MKIIYIKKGLREFVCMFPAWFKSKKVSNVITIYKLNRYLYVIHKCVIKVEFGCVKLIIIRLVDCIVL